MRTSFNHRGRLSKIAAWCVTLLVCGYRAVLRPLMVGTCKFHPSCSEYFLQAVHEWGPIRGSWLGLRRIARCIPWGLGGIDPVPQRSASPTRTAP